MHKRFNNVFLKETERVMRGVLSGAVFNNWLNEDFKFNYVKIANLFIMMTEKKECLKLDHYR